MGPHGRLGGGGASSEPVGHFLVRAPLGAGTVALPLRPVIDGVAWLEDQGVKNIENVNQRLKAATPWFSIYGVSEPAMARA